MPKTSRAYHPFEESYLALRRNVGWLAIGLPFVVVIGAWVFPPNYGMQGSISAYYHTQMRDVFVGVLCATGVFLLTYNPGNSDKSYGNLDQKFGILAGIFAIGVALFPTTRTGWKDLPAIPYESLFGTIHLIFAAFLFSILAFFSYFLFTKSNKKRLGRDKQRRNRIYKICGVSMAACILLMAAYHFYSIRLGDQVNPLEFYHPVFILELVAMLAFGVSWFVKGEALKLYPQLIRQSVKGLQRSAVRLQESAGQFQRTSVRSLKKSAKDLQAQLTGDRK